MKGLKFTKKIDGAESLSLKYGKKNNISNAWDGCEF